MAHLEPHQSPSPSTLRTQPQPHAQPLLDTQQPPTKRDIRRNRITEKLQKLIDSFSSNQQAHYRAQLQALQVDMTLVLRADPYQTSSGLGGGTDGATAGGEDGMSVDPGTAATATGAIGILDEGGEEIRKIIEEIGAGVMPSDTPEGARRDFDAMAGRGYREFARSVADCIEQRDADLTALHNRYTSSLSELETLTSFRLRQAEEEHKALTATIRSRLQQTITKKRQQLLRDKEQLDIADSNALLLHPNHFSINNPGSPPNGLNRKTRHLRHRQGSPNPGDLEAGNGVGSKGLMKKRKALALEADDGNESPAPNTRGHTDALGSRSPFREAREKNVYAQYEAPAYSLERIFTEKELAMATDTAKIATWRYFNQPQQQEAQASQEQDANGLGIGDEVMEGIEGANAEDEVVVGGVAQTTEREDGTPPPAVEAAPAAAVEMERSTSHQVLTRGGAKANPLAALNDLAALATSERAAGGASGGAAGLGLGLTTSKDPFAPVVPSYHAVTRSEKSGAPAPSGVSHADLDNDFAMMRSSISHHAPRGATNNDLDDSPSRGAGGRVNEEDEEAAAHMRTGLLDQALGEQGVSAPYRLPLLETGPALIGKGVERVPGTGFAPVMNFVRQTAPVPTGAMASALRSRDLPVGGEAMSRTTSAGGNGSEMEGVVTGTGTTTRRGRGRLMV